MIGKSFVVILISCLYINNFLVAQNLNNFQQKSFEIKSPTQYQFLKFGEIPINEYSGSPTIEIPLYDLKMKGMSIPIKLQYSSKGIKVTEESDWVGLGWNLSFPSVVQILNDKDDLFLQIARTNLPYVNSLSTVVNPTKNSISKLDMKLDDSSTTYSDLTYSFPVFQFGYTNFGGGYSLDDMIKVNESNNTDHEKDVFVIRLLDETLYVLAKINSNITLISPSNTSYVVLNKKGYNVYCEKQELSNEYRWNVITPSGLKYCFEEVNICNSTSMSQGDTFENMFSDSNTLLNKNSKIHYNSACSGNHYSRIWQITQISNIYGETIRFNYSGKYNLTSKSRSLEWKIGYGYNYDSGKQLSLSTFDWDSSLGPMTEPPSYMSGHSEGENYLVDYVSLTTSLSNQERSYLQSITYNENSINFYNSDRNDWHNSRKLDSIVVYNLDNYKTSVIKLNYNYFESSYVGRGLNCDDDLDELTNRLKLSSVNIDGNSYTLTYNKMPLPPKNSFAYDFWGYYNGEINNITPFPRVQDLNYTSYDPAIYSIMEKNVANKFAVENYCKAAILEKIEYPTKGFSKFSYSLNNFINNRVSIEPGIYNQVTNKGNGLKVDTVFNYSETLDLSSIKVYDYVDGKLLVPLNYFYTQNEKYCKMFPFNDYAKFTYYQGTIFNIHANNCYSLNPIGSGLVVGYSKVTCFTLDTKRNESLIGKTVHYYVNTPDVNFEIDDRFNQLVPVYHKGLENGTLIREEIYNSENKRVKNIQNDYIFKYDSPLEYNSKVIYLGKWGYNSTYDRFQIAYYPIFKPENRLERRITTDYEKNDSIKYVENFFYNGVLNERYNILRSKSITQLSNPVQQKQLIKYYAFDLQNDATLNSKQKDIMKKIVNLNRLNEEIKIEDWIITYGQAKIKTQYNEYDEETLLPSIFKTKIGLNPYRIESNYRYNSKKNIIELIGKDNISTVLLWGYNNQYPIAEIKNASYAEVEAALGGATQVQNIEDAITPDMSKINALRTQLPNAQITTYTYIPLVGMASKTDPRGVTTYFNYDGFGRLQNVQDHEQKTEKSFEYHYKE